MARTNPLADRQPAPARGFGSALSPLAVLVLTALLSAAGLPSRAQAQAQRHEMVPARTIQASLDLPDLLPDPQGLLGNSAASTTASPQQSTAEAQQTAAEAPAMPASQPDVGSPRELEKLARSFREDVSQKSLDRLNAYIKSYSAKSHLRQIFEERRQRLLSVNQAYYDRAAADVLERLSQAGVRWRQDQFFVWADRNVAAQLILVGFYEAASQKIQFLGADLISTGNLDKGGDYFATPTGLFEHLIENFGYRAMGTPNAEGWRGLGGKDSRVWDFGDQAGIKMYKDKPTRSQMRLLMHATDPVGGELRLGRTDSKGCVRISKYLNDFLDRYSILDYHYEQWVKEKARTWLLRADRTPVAHPGSYLIIGDSAEWSASAAATPAKAAAAAKK